MAGVIQYPGVLTNTAGMIPAVLINAQGFPVKDLSALYMLEDGAGTSLVDSVSGGTSGAITSDTPSNDAYAWLTGGGGLSLSGAQQATFPAFDVTGQWTLFAAGSIVGDVTAGTTEKIAGLLGFREFNPSVGSIRGALLHVRGATDLDVSSPVSDFWIRPANGSGGQGAPVELLARNQDVFGTHYLFALSYDGSANLTGVVYNGSGGIVSTGTLSITDTELTEVSGTPDVTLQPSLGGPNSTYGHGQVEFEFAARYARQLSDITATELSQIATNAAAIGAARGRAWS